MRLVLDTLLDRPREEVWRAFDNPVNLRKWQPTLIRIEPVSGVPGRVGSVSRLSFAEDGHSLVLTEKVTGRRDPEDLALSYESSHTSNTVRHRFVDLGDGRTRWLVEAEFHFKGLLRFASSMVHGAVEKRLRDSVACFKAKLEAGEMETG